MRILLDRIESGCPPKFFSKTKNMHIDHKKNVKKIQKNPDRGPVPGLKVFCRVKKVLRNTLGLGFSCSICIFFLNFGGQPTLLFKILSNKILI